MSEPDCDCAPSASPRDHARNDVRLVQPDISQVADLATQPAATELQALLGVPEGEGGVRLPE